MCISVGYWFGGWQEANTDKLVSGTAVVVAIQRIERSQETRLTKLLVHRSLLLNVEPKPAQGDACRVRYITDLFCSFSVNDDGENV